MTCSVRLACTLVLVLVTVAGCAPVATAPGIGVTTGVELSRGENARTQVESTERAFARSMADRDLAAFRAFLSEEAVFFSGPMPLHGANAVAEYWKRYFEGGAAPFSWEPDQVEVLDSGTLALSTGPVKDPQGRVVARFSSIWRQEAPGVWRIVFDRGEAVPAPQP